MPGLVRRPMAESCPRQRRMPDDLEQNIIELGITQCRVLEPLALTQGTGEPVYMLGSEFTELDGTKRKPFSLPPPRHRLRSILHDILEHLLIRH